MVSSEQKNGLIIFILLFEVGLGKIHTENVERKRISWKIFCIKNTAKLGAPKMIIYSINFITYEMHYDLFLKLFQRADLHWKLLVYFVSIIIYDYVFLLRLIRQHQVRFILIGISLCVWLELFFFWITYESCISPIHFKMLYETLHSFIWRIIAW